MRANHLRTIEPFEICSIRPPTVNDSLPFRRTRNCGLTDDVVAAVAPYLTHGSIDISYGSDEQIEAVICLILGKPML